MTPADPNHKPAAGSRGGWMAFALILVGIGGGLALVHHTGEARTEPAPLAVADPARLDFGTQWDGQPFAWTVPLRNQTSEPVQVGEFRASCDCVAVEPRELEVGPGQTAPVTLTIRPRRPDATAAGHPYAIELTGIAPDGHTRLLSARLSGRVRALAAVAPDRIAYPDGLVVGLPSPEARLRVRPHVPVDDVRVLGDVGVTAEVVREGEEFEVRVQVHPPAAGPVTASLRLGVRPAGAPTPQEISVPIAGVARDRVVAEPEDYHFGACPVGEVRDVAVRVRSLTGGAITVLDWRTDGPVAVARPGEADGAFGVKLTAAAAGENRGTVTFRVREEGRGEVDVRARVGVYGLGPDR